MPAQVLKLRIMDEDQLFEEVLDKFINCHEQTYEEFLSTFTHLSKDRMLLPGEVEQELSTYVPSYTPVDRPPINEEKLKPTVKRTMEQVSEILGDEVQPFSLDEEFDYDNVTLTPKYTPEDIDTIKELLKQGRKNTSTNTQQ
ncbi:intraflagellar transport-associated protein isoform X2 [Dipodomys spectabilis]|uniref:intraflagellar transport-associated protein isoform X2 n=1 Tax=Dipodomys spectabilis TaxID=105255 RepID=UPI001C537645|nr:intraflagellar transport-associated protein isoform X2 [Dipodomys spectabilis]